MKYAVSGKTMLIEEPATAKASGVYLGAVMPADIGSAVENEYTNPDPKRTATYRLVLATQSYTPGTPLTYYTGYGWEKWGDWTAGTFAAYLKDFSAALENPFIITIN
jgi:hypothetical protein